MNNDYDIGFCDGLMGANLRGETDEYLLGFFDGEEAAQRA